MDLYVITTQECQYKPSNGNSCEQDWFKVVGEALGSDYVFVEGLSLLMIRLVIFVHKKHANKIHQIATASEATGIGNVIGNKGNFFIKIFFFFFYLYFYLFFFFFF
jgi:hypothetical protein